MEGDCVGHGVRTGIKALAGSPRPLSPVGPGPQPLGPHTVLVFLFIFYENIDSTAEEDAAEALKMCKLWSGRPTPTWQESHITDTDASATWVAAQTEHTCTHMCTHEHTHEHTCTKTRGCHKLGSGQMGFVHMQMNPGFSSLGVERTCGVEVVKKGG